MTQPATWGSPRIADAPVPPEDYAVRADDSLDALLSSHSGATRPAYAVAGTLWHDTGDGFLRHYNGVNDLKVITEDASGDVALTGGLTVDTDTLVVDEVNGRVGIAGAGAPISALQVGASGITTDLGASFSAHRAVDGDVLHYLINAEQSVAASVNETVGLYLGWRDAATGVAQATKIVAGKEGDYTTAGNADSFMAFYTTLNNTMGERMRVNSAGALLHGTTTAGSAGAGDIVANGGIFLGGSAAANKLDDYEEGTWTPTITFGGASVGMTYDAQVGAYTKIGDLVTVSAWVDLSAKGSSTGAAQGAGLPFTSGNIPNRFVAASLRASGITFADFLQGYQRHNTTVIYLEETTNAGVNTVLDDTNFADTSQLMVSVSYRV